MIVSESWVLWMGLMGLLTGSLMNVVVYRLPRMLTEEHSSLTLWLPRSHCIHCQHPLSGYDNIPLLSWLLLRGRCRYCHQRISWHYPATEAFTMTGFIIIALLLPPGLEASGVACFFWFGCTLAIIDMRTLLLPDLLTLPLLWLGLLYHTLNDPWRLSEAIYGAMAGYLSLWCLYHLCRILTRREGLGYGDFKLLAACGAWCGWQSLPLLLVIASLSGILLAIFTTRSKEIMTKPVPFGPSLALSGFLILCWQTL